MRQENLTTVKGGLTRLRTKGAALKDSLFELLNGFVTTQRTVKVRPGTILDATLPAGTIGLTSFGGNLHVFASSIVQNIPVGYRLNVLRAPDGEALTKIHFAEPFMGSLYVAAEFADGDTFHFWLRGSDPTWQADTIYAFNAISGPTITNSFAYRATRNGAANPLWTPEAPRIVGDRVEPTVQNGFYFEVVQIFGTLARSGETEPAWNDAVDGELFNENVDGTPDQGPVDPSPPPADNQPSQDDFDRYDREGERDRR